MAVNNKLIYENQCGNVGIGTDVPNAPLDISKTQTLGYSETTDQRNSARLIVRNSDETAEDFSSISFVTGGSNQAEWSINSVYKSAYNGDLAFKTRIGGSSWSERMRIKNDGNVGIGTDVPDTNLHISGSGNVAGKIVSTDAAAVFQADSISTEASILYFTTAAAQAWKIQKAATTGNLEIRNSTDATKFTMLDNGNVGIGTNPAATLHVEYQAATPLAIFDEMLLTSTNSAQGAFGNQRWGWYGTAWSRNASSYAAGWGSGFTGGTGGGAGDFGVHTVDNTCAQNTDMNSTNLRFVVKNDGKVGIGTPSPGSTLDVQGGDVRIDGGSTTNRQLYFRNMSTDTVGGSVRSDQTLSLFAGVGGAPTQAVTIERETLNVGIGTGAPTGLLNLMADGATPYAGTSDVLLDLKRGVTNTGSSNATALRLANNSNGFRISYGGSADHLQFIDGGNNAVVTIKNGGDVGIGTSSPDFDLHIQDDVEANIKVETNNDGASNFAGLRMYKSRGTNASPTSVANGDTVSQILFYPRDAGGWNNTARMYAKICGTVTSTDTPTDLILSTGTTGLNDRLIIKSGGTVCANGIMCASTCFRSQIVCGSTYLASPYSSVSCAYSSVCLRTDGVFCIKGDDILFCEAAVNKDRFITIGPNSTWCGCLVVGSGAYPGDAVTRGHIFVTNGNIHIDSANSCLGNPVYTYLQWHAGCATIFGNGNCAQIGCIGCAGNLCTNSCVHSPVLCAGTNVNVGASACIETGWFRNVSNNTGLYNVANALHWYTCLACEWKIQTSANASQINMGVCKDATAGCITAGYIYADTSCRVGFLTQGHNWSFRACSNCHTVTICTHCANIICGVTCAISPIVCGSSCVTSPVICGTTCVQSPYMYATCFCGTSCVKGVITCGVTCVVSSIVCASTAFCGSCAKVTCLAGSAQAATAVCRYDDRCVCASGYTAGKLYFGFGSYDNDNASNWADWLLLSSYTDSSGGNINFLTINRNGFGMRLYQRGWANSSTPSSTAFGTDNYVEMIHSGNISSYATGTTINNNADNRVITGSGTADTLNGETNLTFNGSTLNVTGAITASGDITSTSDCRVKSDINSIDCAIFIVNGLCGRRYTKDNKKQIGIIAQEAENILPEIVFEGDDENKMKSVSYGNITAVLIEAIKEQQKEIGILRKELDFLKSSKEE